MFVRICSSFLLRASISTIVMDNVFRRAILTRIW
jgi:hypothetical protein